MGKTVFALYSEVLALSFCYFDTSVLPTGLSAGKAERCPHTGRSRSPLLRSATPDSAAVLRSLRPGPSTGIPYDPQTTQILHYNL